MSASPGSDSALGRFSPVAQAWFRDAFAGPTQAQELGWDAIASGSHTLLCAPTGSGKTLAAFLWCLDRLATRSHDETFAPAKRRGGKEKRRGVSVLYVSPLKALSYDVERNLRAPLAGLHVAAVREGLAPPEIAVATRTGDTPAREREDIRRDPPDILITTPESLYLMLTSRSREVLRTVHTVIVDEIHTMAATKRGAHLALSLERLEANTERPPQRIGLSATQRPLEEVARYLGGDRTVRIADAGTRKDLDLQVIVPLEDMSRPYDNPVQHAATPEGRRSRQCALAVLHIPLRIHLLWIGAPHPWPARLLQQARERIRTRQHHIGVEHPDEGLPGTIQGPVVVRTKPQRRRISAHLKGEGPATNRNGRPRFRQIHRQHHPGDGPGAERCHVVQQGLHARAVPMAHDGNGQPAACARRFHPRSRPQPAVHFHHTGQSVITRQ